ncbi:transporter [Aidingimonas halophila]|uniref:MetA-pathway of phenol degradation n=1 Tax=Aidingimonas halophila TaxID=574349 RepID=A0A1H2XN57_9GAMM|nr:transporter [Aidingimonas halophila]GHC29019.1 hypothetical protein GCM10008094_21320 [Aidingimonas halophila]SDW94275.1 hypothetical protein SAMN05443545_103250 [Aidingimonas halophila]
MRMTKVADPQLSLKPYITAVTLCVGSVWATSAWAQEDVSPGGDGDGEVVREAGPTQSVQNVLREEHALFSDRLTIEPGISYAYSDRSQLALSGFLALDAIFLGEINVDTVSSHITTFDLNFRYGVTERLEFELNFPFLYRSSTYESTGGGGAAEDDPNVEDSVSEAGLGDISASLNYRLLNETAQRPDLVWNVGVRAPTGNDPFGIPTRRVEGSEGNVEIPTELPTGNGVWAVSTGFSVLKTVDPAILFANAGYTYNFEESFGDIDAAEGNQPGDVKLGDSFNLGFGTAFALNERLSLSMSYAHQHSFKSETTQNGVTEEVVGSDANVGTMNFGATYALSDDTSLVTNVAVGLTDDASDLTVSFRMPFQF